MNVTEIDTPTESSTGRHVRVASRLWQLAFLLLALGGCASVDPYAVPPMVSNLERDDDVGYCARLFADIDRRIDAVGARDAESPRIAGFPYLRVDRFSAALVSRIGNEVQHQAWRARLQQLDETFRAAELANAALSIDDLPRCRGLLAAADASASNELRSAAKVPDNYSLPMRAFGAYPLARLPFAAGVAGWHAATRSMFTAPLAALPVQGKLQRYELSSAFAPGWAALPASLDAPDAPDGLDALGVPVLSPARMAVLFTRHAPVLEIDVAAGHDQPGALVLDAQDRVMVDAASPVAYTRLSHTLIGDLIHPQLVYTFWFSERPRSSGVFDLLAGKLDGLVWRVTLDRAGEALVYDSMHACGCYHLFFPTERVVTRDLPTTLDESLFVPQAVRGARANERITLRIESGTHYLQRVQVNLETEATEVQATKAQPTKVQPAETISYTMQDERALTMLVRRPGGTRSAYGADGLMAGSERAERWFFWPMGIVSAGQMRQWGHHATAFIGRRHFDDPLLFDAYFEIAH